MFDSATGNQAIKTDGALLYNATTGELSATTYLGTIATVTQNSVTTMTGLVTVGILNSGSITSGFGNIDIGASTLDCGALTATTGTFSSYLQGTTGNGYLDLRGDSGAGSGVRIDDSGNVLIGTTTDIGSRLLVQGAGGIALHGGDSSFITFDSDKAFVYQSSAGGTYPFDDFGNLILQSRIHSSDAAKRRDIVFVTSDYNKPSSRIHRACNQTGGCQYAHYIYSGCYGSNQINSCTSPSYAKYISAYPQSVCLSL